MSLSVVVGARVTYTGPIKQIHGTSGQVRFYTAGEECALVHFPALTNVISVPVINLEVIG